MAVIHSKQRINGKGEKSVSIPAQSVMNGMKDVVRSTGDQKSVNRILTKWWHRMVASVRARTGWGWISAPAALPLMVKSDVELGRKAG